MVLPIGLEPTPLEADSFYEHANDRELEDHCGDARAGLTPANEVIVGIIDQPEVVVEDLPSLIGSVVEIKAHEGVLFVAKFHQIHTRLVTNEQCK